MSDKSSVHRSVPVFGRLRFLRPGGCPSGGFFQTGYIFSELRVPGKFRLLPPQKAGVPGREITLLHFNIRPVNRKDMINAAVQKTPVMGHQDKSFLPLQILRHDFSGLRVQMIGRLIDQQEMAAVQKQSREKYLGLLPVGKCAKRPPEHIRVHFQPGQLPHQLPFLCRRADFRKHFLRQPAGVLHRIGKIVELDRHLYRSAVFIFSLQEIEKSCFPSSVPSDKTKFPVCIDLKTDIFKNIIITRRVGKRKVFNPYHRHCTFLLQSGLSACRPQQRQCRKGLFLYRRRS